MYEFSKHNNNTSRHLSAFTPFPDCRRNPYIVAVVCQKPFIAKLLKKRNKCNLSTCEEVSEAMQGCLIFFFEEGWGGGGV